MASSFNIHKINHLAAYDPQYVPDLSDRKNTDLKISHGWPKMVRFEGDIIRNAYRMIVPSLELSSNEMSIKFKLATGGLAIEETVVWPKDSDEAKLGRIDREVMFLTPRTYSVEEFAEEKTSGNLIITLRMNSSLNPYVKRMIWDLDRNDLSLPRQQLARELVPTFKIESMRGMRITVNIHHYKQLKEKFSTKDMLYALLVSRFPQGPVIELDRLTGFRWEVTPLA